MGTGYDCEQAKIGRMVRFLVILGGIVLIVLVLRLQAKRMIVIETKLDSVIKQQETMP